MDSTLPVIVGLVFAGLLLLWFVLRRGHGQLPSDAEEATRTQREQQEQAEAERLAKRAGDIIHGDQAGQQVATAPTFTDREAAAAALGEAPASQPSAAEPSEGEPGESDVDVL